MEVKTIEKALKALGIENPHPLQVELLKRFFSRAHKTKHGMAVRMFSKNKGKLLIAKEETYGKRRLLLHTVTILERKGIIKVVRYKGRKYLYMPENVVRVFESAGGKE